MRLLSPKDAMYVTPKTTKSILSHIGSFSVTNDAVFAINGFLDEVLYMLISYLPSEKMDIAGIEASLLKLVPDGPLARDAICSAHNFSKKTLPSLATQSNNPPPLMNRVEPINPSLDPNKTARYEQLRLKCLRYSTLGTEHVNPLRLLLGPQHAGEDFTSITVIFITAILEYLARFLINSIAVMAKQQLRTNIGLEEVFNGLDVDGHIKELFQAMMLYSKLQTRVVTEALTKGSKNPTFLEKKRIATTGISRDTQEISLEAQSNPMSPEGRINDFAIQAENLVPTELLLNENSSKKGRSFSSFLMKGKSKTANSTGPAVNSPSPKTGLFRFRPTIASEQNLSHRSRSAEALRLARKSMETTKSIETTKSEGNNATLDDSFEGFLHANETKKMSLTPNRLRSIEFLKKNEKYQPRAPIKFSSSLIMAEVEYGQTLPEQKKGNVSVKKSETLYEFLKSSPSETSSKVSKKYVPRAPVIMKRSILQSSAINFSGSAEVSGQEGTKLLPCNNISKSKENVYVFLKNANSTAADKKSGLTNGSTPPNLNPTLLYDHSIENEQYARHGQSSVGIHGRRRGQSMSYVPDFKPIGKPLRFANGSEKSSTSVSPMSDMLQRRRSLPRQRSLMKLSTYFPLPSSRGEIAGSDRSKNLSVNYSPVDLSADNKRKIKICTPLELASTRVQNAMDEDNRIFYPLCMCDKCERI
ncbi:hypothetical protein K7432_010968 [Basidiobolus ranarum]|uniref:Uncharacterized protein n=1 Tax=Basidiobolus ranarum TaxID=34480 RepID=A0ABR2VV23_9FUNG